MGLVFNDGPDVPESPYISKGAVLSDDRRYRYVLWRGWEGHAAHDRKPSCVFIMLNSSTADADHDDPTIGRCVGFAKRLECNTMSVVNLFGYRTAYPRELFKSADPVGPDNKKWVQRVTSDCGLIICAWGTHGGFLGQDAKVLSWLPPNKPRFCLGVTKDGHPKHPLYLPSDAALIPFVR
jgi:hypothetical protein